MSATKHPCAGMTKAQIRVFELIGSGARYHELRATKDTLQALLDKELIVEHMIQIGQDKFGPITAHEYKVPLNVHMQWCQWCAENVEDEG